MDEALLFRFFAHELDTAQQQLVADWIASSEENKTFARTTYKLYIAVQAAHLKKRSHPEQIQLAIEKKIQQQMRPKQAFVWKWFQRVAAVLFIPLCIGLAMRWESKETIHDREVTATPGMICSLALPDGSHVWLNSGSSITYPSAFEEDTRTVHLSGEAYFAIQKDPKKRFIVQTNEVSAEVFGTEFNMDAYPSHESVSTTLVEGAVTLRYKSSGDSLLTVVMKPNQKWVYSKENKSMALQKSHVEGAISWRDGKIILHDTPLEEILWILSKRFNVDFVISNAKFIPYSFTGTFSDQQLATILSLFQHSSDIHYRYLPVEITATGEMMRRVIELY